VKSLSRRVDAPREGTTRRAGARATMGWWPFSSTDDVEREMEDIEPPFWESDVVELGDVERRKANYYEGLHPLWPKLGQLMVRYRRTGEGWMSLE